MRCHEYTKHAHTGFSKCILQLRPPAPTNHGNTASGFPRMACREPKSTHQQPADGQQHYPISSPRLPTGRSRPHSCSWCILRPTEVQRRCNDSVPNPAGGLPHRHSGRPPGEVRNLELDLFAAPRGRGGVGGGGGGGGGGGAGAGAPPGCFFFWRRLYSPPPPPPTPLNY
jgi:hypothetical protein